VTTAAAVEIEARAQAIADAFGTDKGLLTGTEENRLVGSQTLQGPSRTAGSGAHAGIRLSMGGSQHARNGQKTQNALGVHALPP
jgi:hypothetical protein